MARVPISDCHVGDNRDRYGRAPITVHRKGRLERIGRLSRFAP
ncbi:MULTISPECIES: hypothetical protein [unclassified Erythrobacter]|nr:MULTISPECIES: hypothetical protein [unclassified Erythrobacter]